MTDTKSSALTTRRRRLLKRQGFNSPWPQNMMIKFIFFLFTAASSDCEKPPLDIAVVIDQTKSIGESNYDMMLDDIKSFIDKFDVGEDKTHFSIVTYAENAKVRVSFDDPKYHNKEALKVLLDDMKEKDKLGSPTRTDRALKTVGEDVFGEENGDRPESQNIMIVFTDGKTNKNSDPYDTVIPPLEVRTCILYKNYFSLAIVA